MKLKFFPMKEVIHYTVFIAVYILFLISTVSLTTRQEVIKYTYDTGTSLY